MKILEDKLYVELDLNCRGKTIVLAASEAIFVKQQLDQLARDYQFKVGTLDANNVGKLTILKK